MKDVEGNLVPVLGNDDVTVPAVEVLVILDRCCHGALVVVFEIIPLGARDFAGRRPIDPFARSAIRPREATQFRTIFRPRQRLWSSQSAMEASVLWLYEPQRNRTDARADAFPTIGLLASSRQVARNRPAAD